MNSPSQRLEPGQIVRVRPRQYLSEDVLPPGAEGDAALVRLSCLDDDAQGQQLEVLWEAQLDAEQLTGIGWDDLAIRGFDPPRLFSAWRNLWVAVAVRPPDDNTAPADLPALAARYPEAGGVAKGESKALRFPGGWEKPNRQNVACPEPRPVRSPCRRRVGR